jgi:hypothetical protein
MTPLPNHQDQNLPHTFCLVFTALATYFSSKQLLLMVQATEHAKKKVDRVGFEQ